MESIYRKFVLVVGIFTLLALLALFINLFGWFMGATISFVFSFFIGGLIWYSFRLTKPLQITNESIQISQGLSISLRESVERLETPWKKILIFYFVLLLFLNINFFWIASEIFSQVLIPFNLFYILVFFLITWIKSNHFRKAKKMIGKKERLFVLSDEGVSVPIELLNESAIYKATVKNQTEILLLWSDILRFEIFDQVGRARPQLRLSLIPSHYYADLMGKIAIFRTQELDQEIVSIRNIFRKRIM